MIENMFDLCMCFHICERGHRGQTSSFQEADAKKKVSTFPQSSLNPDVIFCSLLNNFSKEFHYNLAQDILYITYFQDSVI